MDTIYRQYTCPPPPPRKYNLQSPLYDWYSQSCKIWGYKVQCHCSKYWVLFALSNFWVINFEYFWVFPAKMANDSVQKYPITIWNLSRYLITIKQISRIKKIVLYLAVSSSAAKIRVKLKLHFFVWRALYFRHCSIRHCTSMLIIYYRETKFNRSNRI